MKKDMVKYTFNMCDQMRSDLEQFSKDSGLMMCEIARSALDHYLKLPDQDFGFCVRKDTGKGNPWDIYLGK